MKSNLRIRFAQPQDIEIIVELCKVHAEFEKVEYDSDGKTEKLKNALFTKSPKLFCLLAELDDKPIGFATFMKQFSTWDAENYIYMDCLFIVELARNLHIGEHLINRLKEESQNMKCKLIQWQTPEFNKRAIKFYRRIGAVSQSKQRFFLNV